MSDLSSSSSSPSIPNSPQGSSLTTDIKKTLYKFSPQLRRDFLAILVKMAAKHFNLVTVRADWRTRQGMLGFLSKIWARFQPLLQETNPISWFASIYGVTCHIFVDRHFALFIQNNWTRYQTTLMKPEIIQFMRFNQKEIYSLLKSRSTPVIPLQWTPFPLAVEFFQIIDDYCQNKTNTKTIEVSKIEVQPTTTSSEISSPEEAFSFNECYINPFDMDFDLVSTEDIFDLPSLMDE